MPNANSWEKWRLECVYGYFQFDLGTIKGGTTDFFLALIKEEDWLAERAENILEQYRGRIRTSHWAVIEILMLAKKYNMDPENIVFRIRQIAGIKGDFLMLVAVAHLMKERGMKIFDALHALSCGYDSIISSDRIFDELGMRRIRLEGD